MVKVKRDRETSDGCDECVSRSAFLDQGTTLYVYGRNLQGQLLSESRCWPHQEPVTGSKHRRPPYYRDTLASGFALANLSTPVQERCDPSPNAPVFHSGQAPEPG